MSRRTTLSAAWVCCASAWNWVNHELRLAALAEILRTRGTSRAIWSEHQVLARHLHRRGPRHQVEIEVEGIEGCEVGRDLGCDLRRRLAAAVGKCLRRLMLAVLRDLEIVVNSVSTVC